MSCDLPSYEGWDCPTCMRPMEKEDDHECGTCGMNASEHLSVTSLCRILREVSGCEAKLAVERDKYKALADRLAGLVQRDRDQYGGQLIDSDCDCWDCEYLEPIDAALAAWKEARHD